MSAYGTQSDDRLDTCTNGLQRVMRIVVKIYDNTVLEGHRSLADQLAKFQAKVSKVKAGKHNTTPSQAVDISPYPIPKNWGSPGPDRLYTHEEMKERAKFYYLAGVVKGVAYCEDVTIRWGGDWDSDQDFLDNRFDDLVHFEELDAGPTVRSA